MAICFHCKHCNNKIEAPDSAGGKLEKCPSCHTKVYVPNLKDDEELKLAPIDESEGEKKKRLMEELESKIKVEHLIDKICITFNEGSILEEHKIKKLESAIVPVIKENGSGELTLNFCNVQFMSSSVLGLLVKIHKKVCELGGHLKLINVNPNIYKVFKITQLTKVFDIS